MSTGRPPAADVASMTISASPEAVGALDGNGHPGRCFVVRPGDDVDGRVRLRLWCAARVGLDDHRVADERVLGHRRGELRAEFPVGEVQRALVDEPECRRVPERGGTAVAQDDLVAVGRREQLPHPVADPAHQVLHRRLPVRGAEQVTCGGKRLQLLGPHLRRPAAEPSVGGFEVGGDRQFGHRVKGNGASWRPACGWPRLKR